MAKIQRSAAKESYWRGVLQRYSASGASVREFCRREQLAEASFYAWRRTIGQREETSRARRQPPAFVPAVVTAAPGDAPLALELPGGGVLRFAGPAAAEHLAALIVALQARAAR